MRTRLVHVPLLALLGCADAGVTDQGDIFPVVDPAVAARGHDVAIRGIASDPTGADQTFTLPSDFFENVYQVWDGADAIAAANASTEERRQLAFRRYGMVTAPWDGGTLPGGFQDLGEGKGIAQTCLGCHTGVVNGQSVMGLGNAYFDGQTMAEDAFLFAMFKQGIPPVRPVPAFLPLAINTVVGANNGLGLGLLGGSVRNPDLTFRDLATEGPRDLGPFGPVSSKTPAWWNLKHKLDRVEDDGTTTQGYYYIDGFAPNNYRTMMGAIAASAVNSKETIESREQDFQDLQQYLFTLVPPAFPGAIDKSLAAKGKAVFEANCSRCHGTYGKGGTYRQAFVTLGEVGTDPLHTTGYADAARIAISTGWNGFFGEDPAAPLPVPGYIPPPLDGVWATGPYLHNGSVPSLEAVLFPELRPAVWKAAPDAPEHYDLDAVGIKLEAGVTGVPDGLTPTERRRYIDTALPGLSNEGHLFGAALRSDDERRAVLEYLKTL
jgi:mono/diheme cytochrome c family protein